VSTVSRIQSAVTNGKASFIHCRDATVRGYLYNITGLTISICIDNIWNWTNRNEQRRTVRGVQSQVTECSVPLRSDGHQIFTGSTTQCDVLNSDKRHTLLVNQKPAITATNALRHRMPFGIISFCSTSYSYWSNNANKIISNIPR